MNEPERPADLDIEGLVRQHLQRDSERIDPRPLFERIQATLHGSTNLPVPVFVPRRRMARGLGRWMAAAAAIALMVTGVGFFWRDRTVLAKAETVVREARRTHLQPIDRCYFVEVRRESSRLAELAPNLPAVRLTRLWTRGDRFWVESARPNEQWAWGRDEANRIWMAFDPHTAARLDVDEVPDWLNLYCDLHSLNVEQLLGDVLSKFDVKREASPDGADSSTIRVLANARIVLPQIPSIESVELEIDAETRVIRRMIVRRVWKDQPFVTVTYNLAETDGLDPATYRLEGHLTDPSEIFARDHQPQRRRELLARWFGAQRGRWSRAIEPSKQGGRGSASVEP